MARRTPIAHAVHGALLLFALAGAVVSTHVNAADATGAPVGAVRSYAIGPGPLGHVLAQFAAVSGVPLSFDSAVFGKRDSKGISGNYTVNGGFAYLLNGSGYALDQQGDGTYTLRKLSAAATGVDGNNLPLVVVNDSAEVGTNVVTQGYVASTASFASKSRARIIDTPQSVSVITRSELDARGVQSVTEALRYVPGVAVETYGPDSKGYDWLVIRGFDGQATSDYRDGLRQSTNSYSFFRTEPYGMESIEILRGPSSTLYGQAEAGGMVNRTSKMPVSESLREVEAGFGNHGVRQMQFDLGGAFDSNNEFSYRLTGLARDGNNVFDDRNERRYIAGGLTWKPSGVTRVTLLADYLHDNVGLANNWSWTYPGPVPTHISYSEKEFDKFETEQSTMTYLLEHKLNDTWTFNQKARYGKNRLPIFNKTMLNGLQADGVTVNRYGFRRQEDLEQFAIDNQLAGDLQWGDTRHALLLGVDANFVNANAARWIGAEPSLNLSNPVYGQNFTLPGTLQMDTNTTQQQTGVYAQDQVKLGQRWIITAGGRYDQARTVTDNHMTNVSRSQSNSAFSGRLGLTYLITQQFSAYTSYATSFLPQIGVNASTNSAYDPTRGKQLEVGIKYRPDSKTLLTAAVFNLEKTNVVTTDATTLITRQVGKVRSRGIELEAKTALQKGLDLTASYSYTAATVKQSAVPVEVGRDVPLVPRHLASMWVDYRVPDGMLAGLGMGAGVRYVGATYGDSANLYRTSAHTLLDAALHYDFQKWRLSVNATNLLNKQYLSTCSSSSCYWGATRSVFTSARYSW